ncbi:hypothetical protein [Brevibacillus brevis]|uniref:hypothetical protein n=1 Tax=Brevibacillus brevis TaxID=1393 RepID=UPI001C8F06E5|nr:hypothetical protein [Brevibacillus brevis]MBY0086981.1 hypothetical protein [Brevibacillus brevis]
MIKEKDIFVPSINIRFDIGKEDFIDRYLPTPSHVDPLLGIANGLLNKGSKAHIIVGPYGSGKSLLGTLLANIAKKGISNLTLMHLYDRFEKVNPDIASILKDMNDYRIKYIPVILEGNIGNFRNTLLSSIQRALDKNNVELEVPGVAADILHRIEVWQKDFPEAFVKLQKLVSQSWDWNVWLNQIENYDQKAINWFTKVYPQLTAGSQFQLSGYGDLSAQLEYVLSELKQRNLGLFVVHDEFGRFLQALASNQIHEAMQDIQEIAELVNHSNFENMSFTLITHRNLRQYASRFNEDLQKEFQRIEKRFLTYHVESDQATFIRLASYITAKYRKKWDGPEKNATQGLAKFPLFPELTDFEVANLVALGSFPLHPVSLFALPRLANVVAQNERTLFTLLESDEPGGLKKHFKYSKNWYTIDNLFDYFEPSFEGYEMESTIKESYLLYKRSLRRLLPSNDIEEYKKIIKLLAVWEIANLNARVLPTTDFISFSFNYNELQTRKYLNELARQKIVRYQNDDDRWILYDGSLVDVEKEILNRIHNISISTREKMTILDGLLDKKFYLPNEYNDEKSMTRFAAVRTVHAEEIQSNKIILDHLLQESQSDLAIYLVIVDDARDLERVNQTIISLSKNKENVLFVVPVIESNEYDHFVRKLKVLSLLEQDKYFMSQDKFLPDEITFLKREVVYSLLQILKGYTQFQDNFTWIHSGSTLQVTSERILSKYLSQISRNIYPSTPVVKNEAYNRRHISKVQKTNAIKLIDQIISLIHQGKDDIEISGYGPDYLIYATVLKNNGIRLLHPEKLSDESILVLRNTLSAQLFKGKGTVKELVNTFANQPFGIRLPVIPILFVALLSAEWKYLMFFKNEMYVSSIDGELLWKIIEEPDEYTYIYQVPKEKDVKLAKIVEDVFGDFKDSDDFVFQLPIQLCKILLRWFMSLPRFARSTNKQSIMSNHLRELIKLCEVKPQEALEEIYKLTDLGEKIEILVALRDESERFLEEHKESLQKRILNFMHFNDYKQLRNWADNQQSIVKHNSKLISALMVSNEDTWVEVLSEKLVGVPRESWSDATDEIFETELVNEISFISKNDYQEQYLELRSEDGSILIPKIDLSNKSQLIYENVKRTLHFTGRTVPKDEIRVVLWKLLKELSTEEVKQLTLEDLEETK